MVITSAKQRKVIEAYISLLQEGHSEEMITMKRIAAKAGMSRGNLYHNHFSSIRQIRDRFFYLSDENLEAKVKDFVFNHKYDEAGVFLERVILPYFYEQRAWIEVLFTTELISEWNMYLTQKYMPMVEEYLIQIGKKEKFSNSFLAQLIVREFFAIIATWLTQKSPESPLLFYKEFQRFSKSSLYDLLN
ncbi:MAG: TetR/AcrR family transcriptional regulator [Streptococcaceae bacterium]|jgi:AcrR family transcriptional regulator|nr:TetR/AcrR family transcriptional regulator [Streptococcaceae bacterium]